MRTQHRSGGPAARLVYERALPAVPSAVGRMRHELDAALAELDVPRIRRDDVALVLTEAAANVVVHAYAGGAPGLLYAVAALSESDLNLHVFDSGRGMVPNPVTPGLGVGLALMAQLTDGLDIAPNGEGGLQVTAVFRGIGDASPAAAPEPSHAERLRAYAETLGDARSADAEQLMPEAEAAIALARRLRAQRL